jgi:hypothetical protein
MSIPDFAEDLRILKYFLLTHYVDKNAKNSSSILTKIKNTSRKFAKTIYKTFNRVYTRKNAQVVTSLQQTCSNAVPTTCQRDVFALLVPSLLTSCQRLVDNLLKGC